MPMWDEPCRVRSTNVPMWNRKTKPCLRCGRDVEPSHGPALTAKAGPRGICRDCREADPEWVDAQRSGRSILNRHDDTTWTWTGATA